MRLISLGLLLALCLSACGRKNPPPAVAASAPASPAPVVVPVEPRSDMATWPLPNMRTTNYGNGMTRFYAEDPRDSTKVIMLRFDLRAEPGLRFGIYDADEDDATPDDDNVRDVDHLSAFWAFEHLAKRGRLLAVVNGPFFRFEKPYGHTAAIVRNGKVLHNVGNPRWAFGVNNTPDGPRFALIQGATRQQLGAYEWGSGNVQALVVDRKPTRLLPPPSGIPDQKSPPSEKGDLGPYPHIDYIKTARTSLGWKRNVFAFLIILQGPFENENVSGKLREEGKHQRSGWDIADLQQFWMAWGAHGACNLDGGFATQVAWSDGEKVHYRSSNSESDHDSDRTVATKSIPVLLFPYVFVKR